MRKNGYLGILSAIYISEFQLKPNQKGASPLEKAKPTKASPKITFRDTPGGAGGVKKSPRRIET